MWLVLMPPYSTMQFIMTINWLHPICLRQYLCSLLINYVDCPLTDQKSRISKYWLVWIIQKDCPDRRFVGVLQVQILTHSVTLSFMLISSIISISRVLIRQPFYRGNGASVARIVPYAALHYMAYEQYRRWIILGFPDIGRGPVLDLVAGSFAGGTAVICTYPLDLVRTKLAYQVNIMEPYFCISSS